MNDVWPGLCAAAALVALLVCIIRYQRHAFIALLLVSLFLGLAAGLPPARVVDAMQKGLADILRDVVLLLALGAILGRLLEASGAAELIARRLIDFFGAKNTSLAVLLAAYLIGIPVMFNVGFLLLIPIVWRLQRETNQSLLRFLLPLALSLGITHSLVPPHPGIVGAVNIIAGEQHSSRVMVETIIFGIALSFPLALIGWFGPGRLWANRRFVTAPPNLASAEKQDLPVARSFALAVSIILAPLVLSVAGFGAKLLEDLHQLPDWMTYVLFEPQDLPSYLAWLNHSTIAWLQFLGKPTIALLVPTALAYWAYGLRSGWSHQKLAKLTSEALIDVGGMVFLFGAAGGFKEVIQATGVGRYLAEQMLLLPLTPVAGAFCVAALVRLALGSATASILTASALLANLAASLPGMETLLVLSVACGVTIATQPADSGFWMIKEYGNLTPSDVMLRVNLCRCIMALSGLAILLAAEAWWPR
jgi:gluconate transporter